MPPDRIGRYEIQRRLGTGGMGSLYLARDPALDRLVAIKLLKDDYQDDQELRERFLREARSVARLRHRNIVLVFDVGEHEGRQFMAMEYLSGETMSKVLARNPPVPLAQRVSFAEQLCAGLAHAHVAGIVHRDIKPANIMLDADGVVKILDFGIAHLADSGITRDGMMMGSVNYMSPEQITGARIDHRTDIFAVGAVLYEMVALTQAFPGGFDSGVLNRILNEGPTPLNKTVPGVLPLLAQVVNRALERNPDNRYHEIEHMRRDLLQVQRQLPAGLDDTTVVHQETVLVRPRPSSPPSSRPRRDDTDRRKDDASQRFGAIRRQQAEEHLRVGRTAFDGGDYHAALEAAERAAAIDPEFHHAFELLERTKAALEAITVRAGLDEAEQLLAEGRVDDADPLIERALDSSLDRSAAPDLQTRARKLAEQASALRERRRQIDAGLARARTSIGDQQFDTALRVIGEVLAIDAGNAEARELQANATSALAAQREHELRRRQAHERLDLARKLASEHRFKDAANTLSEIMPPTDTVRMAMSEVTAFIDEQKRAAAHQALLATIRAHIDNGAFEEAIAAVDAIAPAGRVGDVRALRIKAENGLRARENLERKRVEASRVTTTARELCAAGDFHGARELVAEGFRLVGDDSALTEVLDEIARAEREAEEKRQRDVRDRMVTRKIESAKQMAERDIRAALALVEKDDSGHPAITALVDELRAKAARQEEAARARAEQERVRQEWTEQEQADRERAEWERARQEQAARERADQERVRQEQAERERAERERAERERAERAEAVRLAREEAERNARETLEREQQARLAAEAERRRRDDLERAERERQERENRARLEAEAERLRQEVERQRRELEEREKQTRAAEAEERRRQKERAAAAESAADHTVLRQRPQPALDAETTAPSTARPVVVTPTPASAAASRPSSVKWIGVAAAVLVAAAVAVMFVRGRSSEVPAAPADEPSAAAPKPANEPAAVAVTSAPTTIPAEQPPPAGAPVDINRVVQTARASMKQGNLSAAARAIDGSLTAAPNDATLQGVMEEVFKAAAAQAQQAKSAADQADAAARPRYKEAMTRLRSAEALRTDRRLEPAIGEYAAAARLFADAAQAPKVAQLSTTATTIPSLEQTTGPRPPTAPTTVQSTIATTSAPPTTSILPGIDSDTVQRVLAAYASASRNFNTAAIEQIYPGLPANSRLRIDALRKNFNFCDYIYSNVRIVSSTPTEATIRAESLESCKPKTGQRTIDTKAAQQLTLRKASSGGWTIVEILGLQ